VGEVRGGEALDMLQALNTGHDGSCSTIHANGAAAALVRLETLASCADRALPVEAVRAQIATALDVVVHVARGDGGRRAVVEIAEVTGTRAPGVRTLWRRTGDALVPTARPERPPRRSARDRDGQPWP
jgi:pilus assembly protein CpaF